MCWVQVGGDGGWAGSGEGCIPTMYQLPFWDVLLASH